jgi:hypothetical protein
MKIQNQKIMMLHLMQHLDISSTNKNHCLRRNAIKLLVILALSTLCSLDKYLWYIYSMKF